MGQADDLIQEAIDAVGKLRSYLKKSKTKQVASREERAVIKATVQLWLRRRGELNGKTAPENSAAIENSFALLLEMSDKHASRSRYDGILKQLRTRLLKLRQELLLQPSPSHSPTKPSFRELIPDTTMQRILDQRWDEAQACIQGGAHLAATVMLGGLLESLLLAKINKLQDKSPVFTAQSAPREKENKTKKLNEWGLKNYLDVAHELGWIRQSAKDVGEVLRDYRNYIHPHKQLSHDVQLTAADTEMFMAVFCSIANQTIHDS